MNTFALLALSLSGYSIGLFGFLVWDDDNTLVRRFGRINAAMGIAVMAFSLMWLLTGGT